MKTFKVVALATVSAIAMTLSAPALHAREKPQLPAAEETAAQRADSDMADVLTSLNKLGGKPIETLSAAEARKQPTPTDAVNALLRDDGKDPEKLKAAMKVSTHNVSYPTEGGMQKSRIYMPEAARESDEPAPVIVYYHGGGWVIADIDVYDNSARSIAAKTGAIVYSVEYRKGPENKFPAAHNDAFAAYKQVLKDAEKFGGDPKLVAVMGESAGGNLAANVAMMARDAGVQAPVHMALIYPVAGADMDTESYRDSANAKPLNKPMMQWFVKNALPSKATAKDPRIDLVNADLRNLPDATIVNAEIDPLRSEGELLAERLEKAGGDVDQKTYEGVTHEFFGMNAVVGDAESAQDMVAANLKAAFKDAKKADKKAAHR